MQKRHLQMAFVFLCISSLSACSSGGTTLPAANGVPVTAVPATNALVSRETLAASARPTAQPGYGPRVAVGPQPSITCAPSSVKLSPRENIEKVVNVHAAGTAYCFAPGTYLQQSITPHDGDHYIGVRGAILDGQHVSQSAFSDTMSGGPVLDVAIENLVIENYNSPANTASLRASRMTSTGWKVLHNEIESSAALGVLSATNWQIVGNYIHDNAQGGYEALGSNVSITDNEIAHNDPTDAFDYGVSGAGGGKAYETRNVDVSYNYAHNNVGPGLWTDTENEGATITHNDLEDNTRNGIMHEISWDAAIQHNYLRGNGTVAYCQSKGQIYCPAIFISSSGGEPGKAVDISDNTIVASSYGGGIGLLNVARGSGLFGKWKIQNVHVHNNTVSLAASGSTFGAVDHDGSDPKMFAGQGNSFDRDSFTGAGSSAFYWGNANSYGVFSNFAGFQHSGQEMHGRSL